ncbi:MAG TPA: response regulator [Gemmatimonadales bacterium]|nr:response regulator [Gemmatimonadales bacterium]
MTDSTALNDSYLALLVDDREERSGWLARLLEDAGFVVLRERGARHGHERTRAARPDLIVIATDLPDMPGVELCQAVRADPRLNSATPIYLMFAEPATRQERLTALRAGAWDCIAPPHDAEELVLKANVYIRVKREADRTRTEGLLDPSTGLYNRQGLARRARELSSQAFRDHAAIACVALAIDLPAARRSPDAEAEVVGHGVQVLRATARRSDVIGRLGPAEFAVLAPGTDAAGACRLAERMAGPLQVALGRAAGVDVPGHGMRFGYEAVANVGYAPIEPGDLLGRASAALRTGKAEAGGWIRRFDMSGTGGAASAAAG